MSEFCQNNSDYTLDKSMETKGLKKFFCQLPYSNKITTICLLGMDFDAVVVEVKNNLLVFRLALARDLRGDDCIKEIIKQKGSFGLFWAVVGVAKKKNSQLP